MAAGPTLSRLAMKSVDFEQFPSVKKVITC